MNVALRSPRSSAVARSIRRTRVSGFFTRRVLTDRGIEYCGAPDRHPYELYLAVEDIDQSRTKTKNPQTNGIYERFKYDAT